MIKRGRQSAAGMAVVTPITEHRPPVPDGMPDAQAMIWHTVVNRLPYDWFKAEHLELLRAYCQHVCIAQTLARQIERFRPSWLAEQGGLERFDQMSKLLDREHRMMLALARSMRITHQSQYDKTYAGKQGRPGPVGKPWES
jgi:hypothetical protein